MRCNPVRHWVASRRYAGQLRGTSRNARLAERVKSLKSAQFEEAAKVLLGASRMNRRA
jgi:hypothetical protein